MFDQVQVGALVDGLGDDGLFSEIAGAAAGVEAAEVG
jgi:hypothetical protein